MYRAFGLLQPGSDFDLDQAAARLTARFPGFSVTRSGDVVTLAKGDWEMNVALVTGPHVVFETEGIVGKLAGFEPAEAATLVTSDRRVEAWTDIPDPVMEHFNDYLGVVEVLKSFGGLVAVDPGEPAVL